MGGGPSACVIMFFHDDLVLGNISLIIFFSFLSFSVGLFAFDLQYNVSRLGFEIYYSAYFTSLNSVLLFFRRFLSYCGALRNRKRIDTFVDLVCGGVNSCDICCLVSDRQHSSICFPWNIANM